MNAVESRTLTAAHILALWGLILLVAQLYTWIGFFSHGPVSVEPEDLFSPRRIGALIFLKHWGGSPCCPLRQ